MFSFLIVHKMLGPLTALRNLRLDSTHFTGEKTRDKRGHGLNKAAAGRGVVLSDNRSCAPSNTQS